jgi:hypothetical protein
MAARRSAEQVRLGCGTPTGGAKRRREEHGLRFFMRDYQTME